MPATTPESVAARHAPPPAPGAAAPVRVTFTPEVLAELREKAEACEISVSQLIRATVEVYLSQQVTASSDPYFYHPKNIAFLEQAFADYEAGRNFTEHELIELEDDE